MQANKKNSFFLILATLTIMFAGCQDIQLPRKTVLKPDAPQQQSKDIANRFQNTASRQNAIDSALELSKKNADLFEQMTTLQKENLKLAADNRQLKNRVAVLEPETEQLKKELNEANDLLVDMITELNNWKMRILGFQDEMRGANTAQMELLIKIAQAMGAEIIEEQDYDNQSTETLMPGEPNEI